MIRIDLLDHLVDAVEIGSHFHRLGPAARFVGEIPQPQCRFVLDGLDQLACRRNIPEIFHHVPGQPQRHPDPVLGRPPQIDPGSPDPLLRITVDLDLEKILVSQVEPGFLQTGKLGDRIRWVPKRTVDVPATAVDPDETVLVDRDSRRLFLGRVVRGPNRQPGDRPPQQRQQDPTDNFTGHVQVSWLVKCPASIREPMRTHHPVS